MKRQIMPGVIDGQQALCCVGPDSSAQEAAELMAERRIGAVLVMHDAKLVGILTERDMVFRVIAKGRNPQSTKVSEVMTADPITVKPSDSGTLALETMSERHFRHLPVLDGSDVLGIVSIRDLYEAIRGSLEEELRGAETLIYGDQYGSGTAA
ncbi:MAG: CBS domain-containing protein [Geminicoccaceae bacterium]|nr:CBS domain-containing protein [Geminicoccaceae bacterium]MCB9942564.1 CBS domain-containing protein [Geminicoccaceae bacterium]